MTDDSVFWERLRQATGGFISLTDEQVEKLAAHYRLLRKWNSKMNLTTITELVEVVERHYAESLFASVNLPEGTKSIADIGSGAGFPGLPIAISRPELSVCLIESNQRKAAFLREAAHSLANIRVRAVRAAEFTEHVDCVVSRAVRWQDVLALVPGHAERFALMLAERDLAALVGESRFRLAQSIRMPFGESRLIAIGST